MPTTGTDEKAQLDHVQRDLLRLFSNVPETTVRKQFRETVKRFEQAPIRTFVPVLIQKRVKDNLRHLNKSA